jgi:Gpi18-like mannosyltransferase
VFLVGYISLYLNSGFIAPSVLVDMFNHWDAPHYLEIAKNWYISDPAQDAYNFIVFFPLYPILIRLLTFDLNNLAFTALIIANLSSLIAFLYLYKLTKLEFSSNVAVKTVLFLSVFPTAYFLSVPYTEGLFFALTIACIYYGRLGKWHFAGILGLLAALTRIAGLLLLIVLLVEYLHQNWKPLKINLKILWSIAPLMGFLIYLGINWQVTGNPLTFMSIQLSHWHNKFA